MAPGWSTAARMLAAHTPSHARQVMCLTASARPCLLAAVHRPLAAGRCSLSAGGGLLAICWRSAAVYTWGTPSRPGRLRALLSFATFAGLSWQTSHASSALSIPPCSTGTSPCALAVSSTQIPHRRPSPLLLLLCLLHWLPGPFSMLDL